jgi:hypothetical protein
MAPMKGPNQKSQWSVQMPAMAEVPKLRAVWGEGKGCELLKEWQGESGGRGGLADLG